MATLARARAYVQERAPDWCALLQTLVRFDSRFESETEIVEFVAGRLESLGLEIHSVPHDPAALSAHPDARAPISSRPGRRSLVARLRGGGAGRSLALNAHLDVVAPGDLRRWSHPPFSGHFDEGQRRVLGRGAMDDKAGVAISLAVAETLLALGIRPGGDVVWQYVLEDEMGGNGSLLCLEAGHLTDAVMIIDGTRRDRAVDQHAGQLELRVSLDGKAAAVCVSHLGENAAELLARLLIRLKEATHRLNAGLGPPWNRFPSPCQLVVQSIHSDSERLTVPESATAACWITFPPPFDLAAMRRMLENEVAAFARAASLSTAPRLDWSGFAVEPVGSRSQAIKRVLQHCARDLDMAPVEVGPSTGHSDLRHFVRRGIPGLLYGPGNGFNPHRPDEYYEVDDLPAFVLFYVRFVERWCRVSELSTPARGSSMATRDAEWPVEKAHRGPRAPRDHR